MEKKEREYDIVAEVKLWSPFGKRLTNNKWEDQLALAVEVGDVISILTHQIWRGSPADISHARRLTSKPIVAKSFNATDDEIQEALDCGATYVLVVGRQPAVHRDKCWIEPLTLSELGQIPENQMAVWNSRDLASLKELPGIPEFLLERWRESTGEDRKRESFAEARSIRKGKLCQASNLTTVADVQPGADAVLVGSNLEIFAKSLGVTL